MDTREKKKQITVYGMFHPRADVEEPHKQTMRRRKLLRRLGSGRQAPSRPDIASNRTSQG